jgi:indole-3-glycerol phosphate synthase
MKPFVPEGKIVVSESAIRNRKDIETLMKAGIHAFLVGETLMKADDVGLALRAILGQEELTI